MFNLGSSSDKKRSSGDSGSSDRRRAIYRSDTEGYTTSTQKQSKGPGRGGDDDDWLVTYSDAMTLLLVFFVLLISMSEIDQSKFEEVQSAIQGKVLKKEKERPFQEAESEIRKLMKKQNIEQQVDVHLTPLGIKVSLASSALYKPGSAQVVEEKLPLLREVANIIKQMNYKNYIVEVEGHTDDEPINSAKYPSNWELSAHRATNVVRYLVDQGIDEQHLKAAGFADSRPLVPNRTIDGEPIPENQAQNRRVVINIRRKMSME